LKQLVDLFQTLDGCYYLRWRDKKGSEKKHSLGRCSSKNAEKARLTKEKQIVQIGDFPIRQKSIQLNRLLTLYLTDKRTIGVWTKDLLERVFPYLIEAIGNISVDQFKVKHALLFKRWIIESGRNKTTANIYLKAISPVFSWAVKQCLIHKNPFNKLELFPSKRHPARAIKPTEFQQLMNNCPNKLWQARLLLARTAALGRGEVLNLTINDVDFKDRIIRVQPKKDTSHTWQWKIRDTRIREVPLVPQVATLLREISTELPDEQPYLLLSPQRYKRIIQLKRQDCLPDRIRCFPDENWIKPFERIRKRAVIEKVTFEDIRQSCIKDWFDSGLRADEVMRLAGFSDIETFMSRYGTKEESSIDKARLVSRKSLRLSPWLRKNTSNRRKK